MTNHSYIPLISRPLLSLLLCALPLAVQAQTQSKDTTLNRTVVVEQEYAPTILDASKINVLPRVEPPSAPKREVEYDVTLTPASRIPAGVLRAYTGKETPAKSLPGYARLGYGNYGNLDLHAGYLFLLPADNRLNLTLDVAGMDGRLDLPDSRNGWDAYDYRTRAAVEYRHGFRKVDLDVAGHFGLRNFGLLPGQAADKQKFTSGDLHFGVASKEDDQALLHYRAETNLLLYNRQCASLGDEYAPQADGLQETMLSTRFDIWGSLSPQSAVGLAARMDNIFYDHREVRGYTSLYLNPYYRYADEHWNVRVGLHLDPDLGSHRLFRMSPDVSARYRFSDSYILYAQATGGKWQNDLRRQEEVDPYALSFGFAWLLPTYEELNATLGFRASPLNGLWFHLYGGFQSVLDELYTVWSGSGADAASRDLVFGQADVEHFYCGGEVDYAHKGLFALHLSGQVHHWSADKRKIESDLLYLKPALELKAQLDLHPLPALTVGLGYRFVSHENEKEEKAANINNLYLNADYRLVRNLGLFVRADNLLDKHYQYYRGTMAEGINFVAGASLRF